MIKKIERYIVRNWIWLVGGLILTRKAVEYAYSERGYAAFGGEWFILPLILLTVHFAREARMTLREMLGSGEVDVDDGRTSRHHRKTES